MREQYSTQLAIAAGVLILICTAVFSLVQSPELVDSKEADAVKSASTVPHSFEGRRKCDNCHALRGKKPYPLKHTGWSNESCIRCHGPVKDVALSLAAPLVGSPIAEKEKNAVRPIPHPMEEMENCSDCHGFGGVMPYPTDHSGRHEDNCISCHIPPKEKGK